MIKVYNLDGDVVGTFPTNEGYIGSEQARKFCLEHFENYYFGSNSERGWHYSESIIYDPLGVAEYIGDGCYS